MIDWNAIQKAILPIKSFEELNQRWQESFSYPFVRAAFNVSIPELIRYTRLGVGGDPRGRYTEYAEMLINTFAQMEQAGVKTLLDLLEQAATREGLERFSTQSGVNARNIVNALKYLIYWFIPMKKHLSGLVRPDAGTAQELKALREAGIRSNLDLLQHGATPAGRKALANASGLPEPVIAEWVNRADLSRMPWASKATLSNIMGAGYGSLARLAGANPERLYEDFYRYGESIDKNLKLGNEIENSYRIARIVPVVLREA